MYEGRFQWLKAGLRGTSRADKERKDSQKCGSFFIYEREENFQLAGVGQEEQAEPIKKRKPESWKKP